MKTFFKIVLIALAVVIAIKLLPLTLLVGCLLGALAMVVMVVSASAAVALFCLAVVLAAVLAPIWLPVLAVIGLVSLLRRRRRGIAA